LLSTGRGLILKRIIIMSKPHQLQRRRFSIAMVCDFFYPRLGGVENHIWSLAFHLLRYNTCIQQAEWCALSSGRAQSILLSFSTHG
jgi:hypothetical protein